MLQINTSKLSGGYIHTLLLTSIMEHNYALKRKESRRHLLVRVVNCSRQTCKFSEQKNSIKITADPELIPPGRC